MKVEYEEEVAEIGDYMLDMLPKCKVSLGLALPPTIPCGQPNPDQPFSC
jgi:hypothetical protein